MKHYPNFRIFEIDSEIEFQINSREVIGIVEEIDIRINRHEGTVIVYMVLFEDNFINVDGTTFQKI